MGHHPSKGFALFVLFHSFKCIKCLMCARHCIPDTCRACTRTRGENGQGTQALPPLLSCLNATCVQTGLAQFNTFLGLGLNFSLTQTRLGERLAGIVIRALILALPASEAWDSWTPGQGLLGAGDGAGLLTRDLPAHGGTGPYLGLFEGIT